MLYLQTSGLSESEVASCFQGNITQRENMDCNVVNTTKRDLRRAGSDRRATLQRRVGAGACCLYKGLCASLRALRVSMDDLLGGRVLRDFLVALFERVVATPTQVALLFASLSKFTAAPHGGPACQPWLPSTR